MINNDKTPRKITMLNVSRHIILERFSFAYRKRNKQKIKPNIVFFISFISFFFCICLSTSLCPYITTGTCCYSLFLSKMMIIIVLLLLSLNIHHTEHASFIDKNNLTKLDCTYKDGRFGRIDLSRVGLKHGIPAFRHVPDAVYFYS
jgi:hypothetical protein